MSRVVMATGKDLKRVSVVMNQDGTITKGTVEEVIGSNVGRTSTTNKVSKGTKKVEGNAEVEKICLECSSKALPGEKYCSFCIKFMK